MRRFLAALVLSLCVLTTPALASSIVVSGQGPGGTIPDPGPGLEDISSWNHDPLWWADLVSPADVPLPISRVTAIVLRGFHHSWRGDLHVYLENPAGQRFNVIVRPGLIFRGFYNYGDSGNLLTGTYTIVESNGASLAQGSVNLGAGTYDQYLNSDSAMYNQPSYPIANVPLSAISGRAGVWKLHVRDWVTGEGGGMLGWSIYGETDDIAPFCTGSATQTCPCGSGGTGAGCANSSGGGAHLTATGSAHVGANDMTLTCAGMMPASLCIFRQGNAMTNSGFGLLSSATDGLDCIGGDVVRLGLKGHIGASATIARVATLGGVPLNGGERFYQVSYRNAASFCSPSSWNTSNALAVSWVP